MDKILIVGPSWVGDMVMAQALFIALARQGAVIDVLAPEWNFAILDRMPEVRKAIPMPVGHGELKLQQRYQLGKQLRQEKYTKAFVLPNSFKSALIPFFAKIPQRTGWLGEMRYGLLNDARKLDKAAYPLMVQRFVALAYPPGQWDKTAYPYPALKVDPAAVADKLARHQLVVRPEQPILALCAGAAFGDAKRWPAEYYAEIANQQLQQGWQVWLFGSEKDRPVTQQIQDLTQGRCTHLAGQLQLDETVDLMSQTALVISNDSGLLHVAAALDVPVIGIYGSTTPDFTPPLNDKVATLSVTGLACRPCFQRHCKFGHLKCLRDISPATVSSEMQRLLA